MIGTQVGLAAQEVNILLSKAGLIDGEPGAWRITEKGAEFANQTLHSRGTGGYSFMNPSWEVRAWDESVMGLLDFSDEAKQLARTAVSDRRAAMTAAREAANAAAELVRPGNAVAPGIASQVLTLARRVDSARAGVGVIGVAVAYGVYKTGRHQLSRASARRSEELTPRSQASDASVSDEVRGTDDDVA